MSDPVKDNPVLRRDINLVPVEGGDGSTMIVVRDPLELSERGTVAMRAETLKILAMLDGRHSTEDVRMKLVEDSARAGMLTSIPLELVQSFVNQLDQVYLLDNERFRSAREKLVENFSVLKIRPAVLAGKSYPADKEAAGKFIDKILDTGKESRNRFSELQNKEIAALISPHIELKAGARGYASSYGTIAGRSYDRVVILGVGHSLERSVFSFTDKDFETPLGLVHTDKQAVAGLRKAAGSLAARDDFAHRSEHSIEFQVIFLQRALEGPFTIVPVLVGSLYELLILGEKKRPREIDGLEPALDYLARLLSDPKERTLLVAGVDFSHVGLKFGDGLPASRITGDSTAHDRALLSALVQSDVEAFCAAGRLVRDRYHVCGFTALSILLEILPEKVTGVELHHEVWQERETKSAVSFASAAFYIS